MKRLKIAKSIVASVLAVGIMGSMVACGDSTANNSQTTAVTSYSFQTNGLTINIDDEANGILSTLGNNYTYYEAKSCAFDGKDKVYDYGGYQLQFYQKNNKDVLYSVTFMDDTVKTPEGIKIGDAKSKVLSAYSTAKENGNVITVDGGNMELKFTIANDLVTGVIYELK